MASERMNEYLSGAWSQAEWRCRRYDGRGVFAKKLPPLPERQADLDRVVEAQAYADDHTDRQVAAAFPDVVRSCVPHGFWERIKP